MNLDEAEVKCREWFACDFQSTGAENGFRFIGPRHSVGADDTSVGFLAWYERGCPDKKQAAICIVAYDGIDETTLSDRWANAEAALHRGIAEAQSKRQAVA